MKTVKLFPTTILLFCSLAAVACGVKGKPLPPLTPPILGRGEPSLSKATENVKLKKKTNAPTHEPDWDEDPDFSEESNP